MSRIKRLFLRGSRRVPPRPPDPGSSVPILTRLKTTVFRSSTASDNTKTLITALFESADAFPPLKSICGSVLAIWNIADRIKNSRESAKALAMRCFEILNVIADSVHDPSALSSEMQTSIAKFNDLLTEIIETLEQIAKQIWIKRTIKLGRNEDALETLSRRVDEIYRDFNTTANLQTLCVAVQTSKLLQTTSKQVESHVIKTELRFEAFERRLDSILVITVGFF